MLPVAAALSCLPVSARADNALVKRAKTVASTYDKNVAQENVIAETAQMETEYHLKQLDVDQETLGTLRTLRNPFIPALPKEPRAESEKKPAGPQPGTEPTPVTVTQKPAADSNAEPLEESVKKPAFRISGLIWNSDLPQAIMQKQVVKIGDKIENWTITGISRKGVEVSYKNFKFLIEP